MIRFIAAVDEKLGLANEKGIPWQGKIPSDVKFYHEKINNGDDILMGLGVYKELKQPYGTAVNYVAMLEPTELKNGFKPVLDAREFLLTRRNDDIWNIGGALLFKSTIDLADELYLTRLEGEFGCTKFFPRFEDKFELKARSQPLTENGITFCFETWVRKTN